MDGKQVSGLANWYKDGMATPPKKPVIEIGGHSKAAIVDAYLLLALSRSLHLRVLVFITALPIPLLFSFLGERGTFNSNGVAWIQATLGLPLLAWVTKPAIGMVICSGRSKAFIVLLVLSVALTICFIGFGSGVIPRMSLVSFFLVFLSYAGLVLAPCLPFWLVLLKWAGKVRREFGLDSHFLGVSKTDLHGLFRQTNTRAWQSHLQRLSKASRFFTTDGIGVLETNGTVASQRRRKRSRVGEFVNRIDRKNREFESYKKHSQEIMLDREEKMEAQRRLAAAQAQEQQAIAKMERAKKRAGELQRREQDREKSKYERALKKAVLRDPIGSAEKLARLELTLAELRRVPLHDTESSLQIEKLLLEIEILKKQISG